MDELERTLLERAASKAQSIGPKGQYDPSINDPLDPIFRPLSKLVRSLIGADALDSGDAVAAGSGPMSGVGVITRQIAPRRAARELARLLEGKSSRVAPIRQLTEQEAALSALQSSKVGGRAPHPTVIRTSKSINAPFEYNSRQLSRDPSVAEAYKRQQQFLGLSPKRTEITIDSSYRANLPKQNGTVKALKTYDAPRVTNASELPTSSGSAGAVVGRKAISGKGTLGRTNKSGVTDGHVKYARERYAQLQDMPDFTAPIKDKGKLASLKSAAEIIAKELELPYGTVHGILTGDSWSWVK